MTDVKRRSVSYQATPRLVSPRDLIGSQSDGQCYQLSASLKRMRRTGPEDAELAVRLQTRYTLEERPSSVSTVTLRETS